MSIKFRAASLFLAMALAAQLGLSSAPASRAAAPREELPIIMYHNLSANPKLLGKFTLSADEFEDDLIWLRDNGFNTISLSQLFGFVYNGEALPPKPVMLTFDDSFESVLLTALPLLEKYEAKAVVNVLGRPAEELGDSANHGLNYSALNWEQIQTMAASGLIEFGNHTYDLHDNSGGRVGCRIMPGEDGEAYKTLLKNDLQRLQKYMEIYAGYAPLAFAYPFGAVCEEALPVLQELGFKAAFTCSGVINRIEYGDTGALYALGRFNRPSGPEADEFFTGILS